MITINNINHSLPQTVTTTGSGFTLPSASAVAPGTTQMASGTTYVSNGTSWAPLTAVATTSYVNSMYSGHYTMPADTVFISKDGQRASVEDLMQFMDMMKKRLLILQPNFEKHEMYPALRNAYEQYLIIERLCCGDSSDQSI